MIKSVFGKQQFNHFLVVEIEQLIANFEKCRFPKVLPTYSFGTDKYKRSTRLITFQLYQTDYYNVKEL